jgi:F-type H+-transporting ATPase subunit a
MEHENSILYHPVNVLWHGVQHRFAWDIPDHVIMAFLVLVISTVIFVIGSRHISRDNPGPLQHSMEMLIGGLKGLLHDVIGHGGERYLTIIAAFTVFIFIANMFGLFFFLQPPTSNVNTTFALSISAFLYYNIEGIRRQGLLGYLKHFMGPVLWLAPLMFIIEMIGNFARILSLGVRLFGNIFGEHTATGIFTGLVPVIAPMPMMALGIFGALLQTYVFIMLTAVYIAGAVAAEEH